MTGTGDLFANLLPCVDSVATLLEGENVHGYPHHWVVDDKGGRWIRKREVDVGVEVIAAEFIGWQLGTWLEVPLPAGAYHQEPTNPPSVSWLSAAINPVVHWNPERIGYIENLEDLGNILVLDVLIFDPDRHASNLLLEPVPDSQLRLWAIDSGNAFVAHPSDYPTAPTTIPRPMPAPGIPYERIQERAMRVAEQATSASMPQIADIVKQAFEITGISGAQRIAELLYQRCMRAPELVSRYLSQVLP